MIIIESNGTITGTADGGYDVENLPAGWHFVDTELSDDELLTRYAYVNNGLVDVGAAPSPHHKVVVSDDVPAWVFDPAPLVTELVTQAKTLRSERTFSTIDYQGDPFDADPEAREAISQTYASVMRGDGLPEGWVGWRDANDTMHWANDTDVTVGGHLQAIMKLVIDRHQALMKANWAHADAIRQKAEANDVAGLLDYDITTGWP